MIPSLSFANLASWILFVSCLSVSICPFAIISSFLRDYSGDAFWRIIASIKVNYEGFGILSINSEF